MEAVVLRDVGPKRKNGERVSADDQCRRVRSARRPFDQRRRERARAGCAQIEGLRLAGPSFDATT
jgi:hypothetical protein